MQNKRIIEIASLRGIDPHVKTWEDVHIAIKDEFGDDAYSFRHIQRIYKAYLDDTYKVETSEDLQREKYQLADIQREYRALIREQARIDALKDVVRNELKDLEPIPYVPVHYPSGDGYMVVNTSDWHIGAKHENYLGEFNFEIAKKRINRYVTETVKRIQRDKPKEVLILNLNDLIEGNIHISTRVQAEFDAIQQTIKASELLAQFIAEVANHAPVVKVGQVLDNHSRINKNKREHIEAESFGKILEYIVKERLGNHENIKFVGNPIDDNIGLTQLGGTRIAWVHGHLDKPQTVKSKLEDIIGIKVDYVFIAHRHHIMITDNVIQVGSLKGTDEYAFNLRLGERASQTIVTFNDYEFNISNIYF